MKVILDTCVVSEIQRSQGRQQVRAQVERIADDDLYLSVITIGEIAKGVALLPSGKRKSELQQWMQSLEQHYADRILPINNETAQIWGTVTANAQQAGTIIPMADGLIAATAIQNGMHIMTRNTDHFQATGALVIDPWNK